MLDILTPKIFNSDDIIAGVTKRNLEQFPKTGFSIKPANSLTDVQAEQNRRILASSLGYSYDNLKFQKQTHGTNIEFVDKKSKEGANDRISDGMICSEKNVILNVTIADCCAILIFDPINKIIAALHSGWRGTKQNIAAKGVNILINKFNSKASDLLIYLSPCASVDKYEVGEEFIQYFPNSIIIKNGKYYFDNKKEIKEQLLACNCSEKHIEISNICTISDLNYHSYRRDGIQSGRMAAFIGRKY